MVSLESRGGHWVLMAPDFRTLIEDKNAAFSGDFGRPRTGVKMGPENEAYLVLISGQKLGLPYWRCVGRNYPHGIPVIMGRSLRINGV